MNFAIVLASGSGSRFGSTGLKQLTRVSGRPIMEYTLEAFQNHSEVFGIIVVGNAEVCALVDDLTRKFPKILSVCLGGGTRADSTWRGLRETSKWAHQQSKVLIHDAVRPFISSHVISSALSALDHYDAVNTVIDSTDTMLVVSQGFVDSMPNRESIKRGQTPQGFKFEKIKKAFENYHKVADKVQVTDDCAIYLNYADSTASKIKVISGDESNIKVTFPNDLIVAEEIFRSRTQFNLSTEKSLEGDVSVVFGGTDGIGKAITERLQKCGAHVVVLSRRNGCDIRNKVSVKSHLAHIHQAYGKINSIINTVGVLSQGPLVTMPDEVKEDLIDTNLRGALNVIEGSYPYLAQSQGDLVLFSSSSYTRGRANYALYSAVKAALVNLTQGLADEWLPEKINVNCIVPARTNTNMRVGGGFNAHENVGLLEPEDVAIKVELLLRSNLTNQIIRINGA